MKIKNICDFIIKYFIFAAVFLTPLLFLPWTSDVLDFNKQTLLVFLAFVALFCWMLQSLISGKIEIIKSKLIYIASAVLFLVYLFSSIFSVYKYGSLWGWPQSSSESLLSLSAFLVFSFLIINAFSKKDILNLISIFAISGFLAELIGILQIFSVLPFNTLGAPGTLGVLAAALLPVLIFLIIASGKNMKIVYILQFATSVLILLFINFPIVWWALAAGAGFFVVLGILKRNIFDARWQALPIFFLAVSLFFAILNPQIQGITQRTNEIFLSQKASFEIVLQELKQNPVLGSGPGTFDYDFLKYKNAEFSKTPLWQTAFNKASSKILTLASTTGILGVASFLFFLFVPFFYGLKFIFSKKSYDKDAILIAGLLAGFFATNVSFFLYNSNMVLNFMFFFFASCITAFVFEKSEIKKLHPSSFSTLFLTFIFTLLFIFGVGILFLQGQKYLAEINYAKGFAEWQAGSKDNALKKLEIAASLNTKSNLYFTQLSQAYLLKMQDELKNISSAPSDEQKNRIQMLVANSVNASKIATDINKNSAASWSARGFVYKNLSGFLSDAEDWAIKSYNEAIKLDPNNPYLFLQRGVVYYQKKDFNSARSDLEKALNLKPDYSDALSFQKTLENNETPK